MIEDRPLTRKVVARTKEFFEVRAPWQRRLWETGLSLTLHEIVEASEARATGSLSSGSLQWFATNTAERISKNPAAGMKSQREHLQSILRSCPVAGTYKFEMLRHIAEDVSSSYFERWASALEAENHGYNAERIARALAAAVLDAGISENHAHRWITWLSLRDEQTHDLASLFRHAQAFIENPHRKYKVLVPANSKFPSDVPEPAEWLREQATLQWLKQHDLAALIQRTSPEGSLLLKIHASSPEAAVQEALETISALTARIKLGSRRALDNMDFALVAGEKRRYPLNRSRRVEVRSLQRENAVSSDIYLQPGSAIDGPLQLLSHLDSGPAEVAVAGGWSCIEALLAGAGEENVLAADRLADLVACSWPRAELTTLAWERIKVGDALSTALKSLTTNRDRAVAILRLISEGQSLGDLGPESNCAVNRMAKLYANPKLVLSDVRTYATVTFRRLYRNRNYVLHGGNTAPVGLQASLRNAAPLVGAGADRIVHRYLVSHSSPIETASKARLGLMFASQDPENIADLLE